MLLKRHLVAILVNISTKIDLTEIRAGRNHLRPRCNTERKLEKMKQTKKQQIPVQTVSWREASPEDPSNDDNVIDLFPKKEKPQKSVKESLLSMKIEKSPEPVENPFADFSKFDSQEKSDFIPLRVFVPEGDDVARRSRFVQGRVHPLTLVSDVIGFVCYKYVNEGLEPSLRSVQVDSYSLYLADPDGSIGTAQL